MVYIFYRQCLCDCQHLCRSDSFSFLTNGFSFWTTMFQVSYKKHVPVFVRETCSSRLEKHMFLGIPWRFWEDQKATTTIGTRFGEGHWKWRWKEAEKGFGSSRKEMSRRGSRIENWIRKLNKKTEYENWSEKRCVLMLSRWSFWIIHGFGRPNWMRAAAIILQLSHTEMF